MPVTGMKSRSRHGDPRPQSRGVADARLASAPPHVPGALPGDPSRRFGVAQDPDGVCSCPRARSMPDVAVGLAGRSPAPGRSRVA
jgi:hypothetical protein